MAECANSRIEHKLTPSFFALLQHPLGCAVVIYSTSCALRSRPLILMKWLGVSIDTPARSKLRGWILPTFIKGLCRVHTDISEAVEILLG